VTTARERLAAHAAEVAPLLLGASITSHVDGLTVAVRVTEVEAYGGVGEDAGSHAFRRRTPRNASMFGRPGHAYVYLTYGMHVCINVATRPDGVAGAVLIRAGEVARGRDVARERRGPDVRDRDLARGPSRLAVALGVTRELDGVDLLASRSPLQLRMPEIACTDIEVTARTGVGGPGAATPWRFAIRDEPTVSRYRPAAARRR
jgi:DNA-3-methyladenine glycosylase